MDPVSPHCKSPEFIKSIKCSSNDMPDQHHVHQVFQVRIKWHTRSALCCVWQLNKLNVAWYSWHCGARQTKGSHLTAGHSSVMTPIQCMPHSLHYLHLLRCSLTTPSVSNPVVRCHPKTPTRDPPPLPVPTRFHYTTPYTQHASAHPLTHKHSVFP